MRSFRFVLGVTKVFCLETDSCKAVSRCFTSAEPKTLSCARSLAQEKRPSAARSVFHRERKHFSLMNVCYRDCWNHSSTAFRHDDEASHPLPLSGTSGDAKKPLPLVDLRTAAWIWRTVFSSLLCKLGRVKRTAYSCSSPAIQKVQKLFSELKDSRNSLKRQNV